MKGPLDRTKVVVRHLPPTISESNLVDHVDSRFLGRYDWLSFRPGKSSQKHPIHSRAYINFNRPEDVIEFAEFFNGHAFVNEKGAQFKVSVEYAPSQRVPKHCSKKDGREGTILKDPEYLEFLEFLAKPTENLPSAEIQLERKEAERAGAVKDVPIVTPLMDYVRKKRASKGGARRSVLNGKSTRGVAGHLSKSPVSGSSKRGPGKRRTPTTMYVLRDSSKASSKGKPTYLLVSRQDGHHFKEKSANLVVSGTDALEGESGGSGSVATGKKILLLKGKAKEDPNVSSSALQQGASSPSKSSDSSAPVKQNPQQEAGGKIISSILRNRDARRNHAPPESQSELRILTSNPDREKRPPRSPSTYQKEETNGIPDDKPLNNDMHTGHTGKQERWIKSKDRPDRGVWTPLRHSDGSHSSNDSLTSAASPTSQSVDSVEDVKNEMLVNCGGDFHNTRGGRGSHYSVDNGAYRHGGRRRSVYNPKDLDGSSAVEAKSSKRAGYGSHEKQVWVQKSSSGS